MDNTDAAPLNALHPSVASLMDPEYAKAYEYQIGKPRADQVPYATYNADRAAYSFPTAKVTGPYPDVGTVTRHSIHVSGPDGHIEVEIYTPTAAAATAGGLGAGPASSDLLLPAVVDFHGGGFVIGGLKADESWCRQVCQAVGCIMVNVDYRLSPEYPHPVPTTDGYAALKWVVANAETLGIDKSRLALAGLSAGGCIAAACALMARDDPGMQEGNGVGIKLQMLFVPVLDARFVPEEKEGVPGGYDWTDDDADERRAVPYESYRSCEHAPMLPLARLVWFYNLWLGTSKEERRRNAEDFRASPMVAGSLGGGLAPATLHVAEIDPLRSEAEVYHEKLLAAGTRSKIQIYKGVGHTFAHWDGAVSAGHRFFLNTAAELREAFKLYQW